MWLATQVPRCDERRERGRRSANDTSLQFMCFLNTYGDGLSGLILGEHAKDAGEGGGIGILAGVKAPAGRATATDCRV